MDSFKLIAVVLNWMQARECTLLPGGFVVKANNECGILLLHGFAGSRSEITPLKDYLERRGFVVSAPVLAGHGSTRSDMRKAKYTDWIVSGKTAALELNNHCDRQIIVGFSTGGLVGVHLCREMDVAGLVFINTPVFYWNIKHILANLIGDFRKYSKKYLYLSIDKPLLSLFEFLKILRKTKPLFSEVNCPVAIIQAENDDTVNSRSADYIYRKISGEKTLIKYKTGGHQILETETKEDVCSEIEKHIGRCLK